MHLILIQELDSIQWHSPLYGNLISICGVYQGMSVSNINLNTKINATAEQFGS